MLDERSCEKTGGSDDHFEIERTLIWERKSTDRPRNPNWGEKFRSRRNWDSNNYFWSSRIRCLDSIVSHRRNTSRIPNRHS